ncbi:MAG: HEAT repeat domain-containing protein [Symplocastrum torsivum CPER-KK1]|jgi:HEAT repeat protein|uniref:HEAT repeat domain-containing protein n=1 Tax=Symplocastrum torsivum CPER-KK1 TaxID=450513 RepID=A0A951PR72_9CYAN|nr:HEAT repeat domain-containing protein [Symplocastrum torsivum CPER-KK1]
MVNPTRAKFLAAAVLKVAVLCLSLSLLVSSNSWAQPTPYTQVAPLIEKLTDNDFRVRHDAADAIAKIGSPAVPALIEALKSEKKQVRWRAASALGEIGAEASSAVPALTTALQDEDEYIRRISAYALGKIGLEAALAVPDLIAALQDTDRNLRLVAAYALGKIGAEASSAVPNLITALQDTNAEVRLNAATALGRIGAESKTAVPALIVALQDTDKYVRQGAADALGRFGTRAKTAVPALITALQDKNNYVRLNAAAALGRIGLEAKPAIPALIAALQDEKEEVRRNAANGLGGIAGVFQDKAKTLSSSELEKDISDLEKALKIVEDPEANFAEEYIAVVRRPLLALKAEKETRLFDRTLEWILKHQWLLGFTSYVIFVPLLWLALLWIRPLWLLRINNALKPYTDVPLPFIGISVPIRFALFVGFFHYHPRVLDAWVTAHITSVREKFQDKDTVRDRNIYIPVPVVLDGETVAQFTAKDLRSKLKKRCLLIWGEGGAGKTSLACQIAKWALSEDETERLCDYQMLPVLIEEELDFDAAGQQPFMAAIRGQLQDLTNEAEPISEELLERLLRQRRILVIVDHLSEMTEATRKAIRPELPDFWVNALVITSRTEETLGKVTKTTLKPLRIEGNRLSSFMEAYLTQRGKRDRFTDTEFFDACSRLSVMVGARNITVLLAKLYAEQLIAVKDGTTAGTPLIAPLPDNIPDLMLSYLNELNRDVTGDKFDDRTVQEDAKAIAWECLKLSFRPVTTKRQDAIAVLIGDNAEARLQYLEHRLRLIQTIGPAQDQIRFALDPLAEYLAALQLLEHYGKNQGQWRKFLAQTAAIPGAPVAIQGFLLAVLDCCLAKGAEAKVPDFVSQELSKRAGASIASRQAQLVQTP